MGCNIPAPTSAASWRQSCEAGTERGGRQDARADNDLCVGGAGLPSLVLILGQSRRLVLVGLRVQVLVSVLAQYRALAEVERRARVQELVGWWGWVDVAEALVLVWARVQGQDNAVLSWRYGLGLRTLGEWILVGCKLEPVIYGTDSNSARKEKVT